MSSASKTAPRCRELRHDIFGRKTRGYLRAAHHLEYDEAATLLYELKINASMMELIRIIANRAARDQRSTGRDLVRLPCACIYV